MKKGKGGIMKELNEMTFAELDEVIEKAKELKKEKKAEADEANREKLKGVEEGTVVSFMFKGEEEEGTFVKVTDKRFTVILDGQKKSIMFNKLTGIDSYPV
jgi:hypothetical protein